MCKDTWNWTVARIGKLSDLGNEGRTHDRVIQRLRCSQFGPRRIEILELTTSNTATIFWRDTTCSYAEQRWRRSSAYESGQCALTGDPIKRGDAVYKPMTCRDKPVNRFAMILAKHITVAGEKHDNPIDLSSLVEVSSPARYSDNEGIRLLKVPVFG